MPLRARAQVRAHALAPIGRPQARKSPTHRRAFLESWRGYRERAEVRTGRLFTGN